MQSHRASLPRILSSFPRANWERLLVCARGALISALFTVDQGKRPSAELDTQPARVGGTARALCSGVGAARYARACAYGLAVSIAVLPRPTYYIHGRRRGVRVCAHYMAPTSRQNGGDVMNGAVPPEPMGCLHLAFASANNSRSLNCEE